MTNRTPRAITLPPAADADVRHIDGHDVIVLTDPDTGHEFVLSFADSHPGDVCATISALQSALKSAEGRYADRELVLEYGAVA